jgi:hypothetical protein
VNWEDIQSMAFGVLGMRPDHFWNLTYYEFLLACKGYKERVRQGINQAWWTANLNMAAYHNPKRFPKFEKICGDPQYKNEEEEEKYNNWMKEMAERRAKRPKKDKK